MSRVSKEINRLVNSIERPVKTFKCSNCGEEKAIPQHTDFFYCTDCGRGIMLRQDIIEFTGVPEIDNKLAEEYMSKYHYSSELQAADNLDIDDMDSTEWMML